MATTERQGLDGLLALFPDFDLLEVNWKFPDESRADPGPWLIVLLGQRSDDGAHAWAVHHYAIWKRTGAVHLLDAGMVIDPPIIEGRS